MNRLVIREINLKYQKACFKIKHIRPYFLLFKRSKRFGGSSGNCANLVLNRGVVQTLAIYTSVEYLSLQNTFTQCFIPHVSIKNCIVYAPVLLLF